MKRKLHFAITLVGKIQIVILDKPTCGLNPEPCLLIWDVFFKVKHNKTNTLSTHIMKEADAHGDRISIMYKFEAVLCLKPFF